MADDSEDKNITSVETSEDEDVKEIPEEKSEETPDEEPVKEVEEPETRGVKEEKEDEPAEPEEVAPEDKETISKIVDEKLKSVSETLKDVQAIKDRQEVDALISSSPEYSPYKESILKYAAHPAYKNVPIKFIASALAAKDLQKVGAQKEREARKQTEETKGDGTQFRKPSEGKTDWRTVSKEDFEAQKAKVLGRQGY
jgi:hypothetical protein